MADQFTQSVVGGEPAGLSAGAKLAQRRQQLEALGGQFQQAIEGNLQPSDIPVSGLDILNQAISFGRAGQALTADPLAQLAREQQAQQEQDPFKELSDILDIRERAVAGGFETTGLDEILGEFGLSSREIGEGEEEDFSFTSPITRSYVNQVKNRNIKKITEIPADVRTEVIQDLDRAGVSFDEINKKAEGEGVVEIVKTLFDLYTGDEGLADDLSKGRIGGVQGMFRALTGKEPDIKNYNRTRNAFIASVKEITGDTGILTEQDAKRLKGAFPKITDTPEEAQAQWKIVDDILQAKYGLSILGQQSPSEGSFMVGDFKIEIEE